MESRFSDTEGEAGEEGEEEGEGATGSSKIQK